MQLGPQGRYGQLTYCTNIHAGEAWGEVRSSLERYLPGIKAAVAPDQSFGVGLRLGARACEELLADGAVEDFKALLAASGCYVFTINAFPYGPFHGQAVKEQVYAPDWSDPARLAYSNQAAEVLARLVPDSGGGGLDGSVSTVPGSFKPWVEGAAGPGRIARIADQMIEHTLYLMEIEDRHGRSIALALEPEPCCMLETIEETVDFFERELFSSERIGTVADRRGCGHGDAEAALRRHLGVCYDVCHAAVEYEDARESVDMLARRGIAVPKLQLSAALRIAPVDDPALERLQAFNEPVYLHQTIARDGERLTRYRDLPDAFADAASAHGKEWRVHFHVPIFIDRLEHFGTTQGFLDEILAIHRAEPIAPHLEVETYTWDVLPPALREDDLGAAIARELNWVKERLAP